MENSKHESNYVDIRITNIPIIDEGHRKLYDVQNRIKNIANKGACKNDLTEIFFALSYFFENYLIKEELFLKSKGYAYLDDHKSSHLEFIKGIERLKDNFENDIVSTLNELDTFIGDWLQSHSSNYSKDLVDFLNKKKEPLH